MMAEVMPCSFGPMLAVSELPWLPLLLMVLTTPRQPFHDRHDENTPTGKGSWRLAIWLMRNDARYLPGYDELVLSC